MALRVSWGGGCGQRCVWCRWGAGGAVSRRARRGRRRQGGQGGPGPHARPSLVHPHLTPPRPAASPAPVPPPPCRRPRAADAAADAAWRRTAARGGGAASPRATPPWPTSCAMLPRARDGGERPCPLPPPPRPARPRTHLGLRRLASATPARPCGASRCSASPRPRAAQGSAAPRLRSHGPPDKAALRRLGPRPGHRKAPSRGRRGAACSVHEASARTSVPGGPAAPRRPGCRRGGRSRRHGALPATCPPGARCRFSKQSAPSE